LVMRIELDGVPGFGVRKPVGPGKWKKGKGNE